MMREEYEELAGRKVSQIEYSIIDRIYSADPRSKEVFVKAVIKDIDGIQTRIMRLVDEEVEKRCADARKPYAEKISSLDNENRELREENSRLNRELERALEYVPYETSRMTDVEYFNLINDGSAKEYDFETARRFIAEWFGFDISKIGICFEMDVCMKDRWGRIHTRGSKERAPFYVSSDWNYVRFNVVDMQYECVNGELYIL